MATCYVSRVAAEDTAAFNRGEAVRALVRLGGMLLLMGLLHGLNVLTLPVIGRIFTLNRQLDDDVAGPRAA